MAVQRYMEHTGEQKWEVFLPQFLHSYNHRTHSTTKQKPIDVISDPSILVNSAATVKVPLNKFSLPPIGSFVRLNRLRSIFDKESSGNYTEEVFRVTAHKLLSPIPMIRVVDLLGQPILGALYPQEYQPIRFDPSYSVNHVLKTRKVRGHTQYLVSFHGFPSSYTKWIDSL